MATTISDAPRISASTTIDNNVELPAVKSGVDKGKITLGEIADFTVTGIRNQKCIHGIRFLNSDGTAIDTATLYLAYEQDSNHRKLVHNIYINGLPVEAKDEITSTGVGATILIAPTYSRDIAVVLEDETRNNIACICINVGFNSVTKVGKLSGPVELYVDTTKVTIQKVELTNTHIGSNVYTSISVLDIYLG